jgi:hypothetical protein
MYQSGLFAALDIEIFWGRSLGDGCRCLYCRLSEPNPFGTEPDASAFRLMNANQSFKQIDAPK